MSDEFKPLIAAACERPLDRREAEAAFSAIMDGAAEPSQVGGFLAALRTRGESASEFAAAAAVMRAKCRPVKAPPGAIDIVGTGGDGVGTLNISTAAALVAAGAGACVAKHGNRSISSRSGAADALSGLGINVMVEPPVVERAINEAGIGFMMAPMHHPAMRNVMGVRQDLGIKTIFNILGPLTNPAGAKLGLIGAFSKHLIRPMAETLRTLGAERAWVVHGRDGTDEISISGPTDAAVLENGEISEAVVAPEDAGLPRHPVEAIAGGSPEENCAALKALLNGERSAYRDAALLNAAAALVIAGTARSLRDGVAAATGSIDSGKALEKAESLARITSGSA